MNVIKTPRPKFRTVARSAVTARFRTMTSARRHPRTSVIERVRSARRRGR